MPAGTMPVRRPPRWTYRPLGAPDAGATTRTSSWRIIPTIRDTSPRGPCTSREFVRGSASTFTSCRKDAGPDWASSLTRGARSPAAAYSSGTISKLASPSTWEDAGRGASPLRGVDEQAATMQARARIHFMARRDDALARIFLPPRAPVLPGLANRGVALSIRKLLASGAIRNEGQRCGTRYFAAGRDGSSSTGGGVNGRGAKSERKAEDARRAATRKVGVRAHPSGRRPRTATRDPRSELQQPELRASSYMNDAAAAADRADGRLDCASSRSLVQAAEVVTTSKSS